MKYIKTEIDFTEEEFFHLMQSVDDGLSIERFVGKISGCKEPLFSSESPNDQVEIYPQICRKA